jgi:hypothetical protein
MVGVAVNRFEIPIVGGAFDGDVTCVDELRPWLNLGVFPPVELLLRPDVSAATAISAYRIETYLLQWFLIPMLDVDWIYPVYVHNSLKEFPPTYAPGNTHVIRRLTLKYKTPRLLLQEWLREARDRQQFLEADTELDCWTEGDTELEDEVP